MLQRSNAYFKPENHQNILYSDLDPVKNHQNILYLDLDLAAKTERWAVDGRRWHGISEMVWNKAVWCGVILVKLLGDRFYIIPRYTLLKCALFVNMHLYTT